MTLLWSTLGKVSLLIWILVPVAYWPLTQDPHAPHQFLLLGLATLFGLLSWAGTTASRQKIIISSHPLSLPLGLTTLASLVSLLFASQNKVEALLAPFGPASFFFLTLLSLVFSQFKADDLKLAKRLIAILAAILGMIIVWQKIGLGLIDRMWIPTGSILATSVILITALILVIEQLRLSLRHKKEVETAIYATGALFISVGLVLSVINLWSSWSQNFLPYPSAWAITLEILKNPKSLLVGVGPEQFIPAFQSGRPMSLNLTPAWALTPSVNTGFLLHLLITSGILGGLAWGWFLASLLNLTKTVFVKQRILGLSLIISFLTLAFAPPTLAGLSLVFLTILAITPAQEKTIAVSQKLAVAILSISLITFVSLGYLLGRVWWSEMVLGQALSLARAGQGNATYQKQIQAIRLLPFASRYHQIFSRTNLALVQSLLSQAKMDVKNLSEEDKKTLTSLLSQAVREAKLTAQLAPLDSRAWENLGDVYQELIPLTTNAYEWTVASHQRAIQLYPTNPLLRIKLGGIYAGKQNYEAALEQFRAAALVKTNLANAYYNQANVYRLKGDAPKAREALLQALNLVQANSPDAAKIQNELDNLPEPSPLPTPIPSLLDTDLFNP